MGRTNQGHDHRVLVRDRKRLGTELEVITNAYTHKARVNTFFSTLKAI